MKRRIPYLVLLIVGILGIVDTICLIAFTNMNAGILLPGISGLIFVVYAYLKLRIYKDKPVIRNRILKNLLTAVIGLFAISFMLIEGMIIYNGTSQESVRTDFVIILGAGLKGDTVSLSLMKRLEKGVDYLNKYNDTEVVVSGGQGFEEKISEAEAMKRYLIRRGIDSNRILMEDRSTSTMENFKFSKKVLAKIGDKNTADITIITNDFHMLRAKMLARRNGFEPYGITCSTPLSVRFNSYIREYFALIKSFFIDK